MGGGDGLGITCNCERDWLQWWQRLELGLKVSRLPDTFMAEKTHKIYNTF